MPAWDIGLLVMAAAAGFQFLRFFDVDLSHETHKIAINL